MPGIRWIVKPTRDSIPQGNYMEFPDREGSPMAIPGLVFMISDKQATACLQGRDQPIQVRRLMVVPNADPKQGFSLRYAWWPDGRYQQALPGKLSSQ